MSGALYFYSGKAYRKGTLEIVRRFHGSVESNINDTSAARAALKLAESEQEKVTLERFDFPVFIHIEQFNRV